MSTTTRKSTFNKSRNSRKHLALMPAFINDADLGDMLNFTLPPRSAPYRDPPRRGKKANTHRNAWSQEKYINAQYRFVMRPSGDYTVHFADPDIYFNWQDVEQIIIPRRVSTVSASNHHEDAPICPICLSAPIAPRMTKCGHLFCYHCFLHYLANTGNKWVRCPICFDSVSESQLKKVKWYDRTTSTGFVNNQRKEASSDKIVLDMRLMCRPQITTLALPQSDTWPSEVVSPLDAPFHFVPDVYSFARFMLATPDYLRNDLTMDLEHLQAEGESLQKLGDIQEVAFIHAACNRITEQLDGLAELDTDLVKKDISTITRGLRAIERSVTERARPGAEVSNDTAGAFTEYYLSAKGNQNLSAQAEDTKSSRHIRNNRRNINPPPPSTSTFHFYQADDGSNVFLHPLDIRILLAKFSSYSAFPTGITIGIEAYTDGGVDEALRKRCRYLAHLPEAADVTFVEANLEAVVGKDGLAPFENALKMRRNRRQDKQRREERAKVKAEEQEREKERDAGLWRDVDRLTFRQDSGFLEDGLGTDIAVVANELPEVHATEQLKEVVPQGRSFASAAASSALGASPRRNPPTEREHMDEEVNRFWHDFEHMPSTGRKGSKKKMLVLGGITGRRR